jgi:hypothetical protein
VKAARARAAGVREHAPAGGAACTSACAAAAASSTLHRSKIQSLDGALPHDPARRPESAHQSLARRDDRRGGAGAAQAAAWRAEAT